MEYRGIKWDKNKDLSETLGKNSAYVAKELNRGKTHEQIIDSVLDKKHSYRGFAWTSNHELCQMLGKHNNFVYRELKRGKTYEEIIDDVLINECGLIDPKMFHGVEWKNNTELAKCLAVSPATIGKYKKSGMSYDEIIDAVLSRKHTYKSYSWSTNKELAEQLGVYEYIITRNRNKGMTYKEIINSVLDKQKQNKKSSKGGK